MVPRLRFVIMFITIIICTLLPYTIATDSGTPGGSRRVRRGSGSQSKDPADESQPATPMSRRHQRELALRQQSMNRTPKTFGIPTSSWQQQGSSSQQQPFITDTEFESEHQSEPATPVSRRHRRQLALQQQSMNRIPEPEPFGTPIPSWQQQGLSSQQQPFITDTEFEPVHQPQFGTSISSWQQLGLSSQQQLFTTDTEFDPVHQPQFDVGTSISSWQQLGLSSQQQPFTTDTEFEPVHQPQFATQVSRRHQRELASQQQSVYQAPDLESEPFGTTISSLQQQFAQQQPFTTESESESVHQPQLVKTCKGWLTFCQFGIGFFANQLRATELQMIYNPNINYWCAGFAYGLFVNTNNFEFRDYTRTNFCLRHTEITATYPMKYLQEAKFSCQGWIHFYGYTEIGWPHFYGESETADTKINLTWIRSRKVIYDDQISIWAASYFQFISADPESRGEITARDFCEGVIHHSWIPPSHYPFMTLDGSEMSCTNGHKFPNYRNDLSRELPIHKLKFVTMETYMYCQDWIGVYGYTEDIDFNLSLLNIRTDTRFDGAIAYSASNYVKHLRYEDNLMTPSEFCEYNNFALPTKINYRDHILGQ